jgi:hypothetical protein
MFDFQITSLFLPNSVLSLFSAVRVCGDFFTLKKTCYVSSLLLDKQNKKKFLHFTCEPRAVEKFLVARQHINTNGHPVSFALCLGDCRPD